ncbi:MAG: glycine zipper 2TM domain-containing protein [Xanthomonadales bacterium]|nr:glycine zipper 2TM domain-containing protein [Xanthomonadales bacterium]
MKVQLAILIFSAAALVSGCADTGSLGGGPDYGERSGTVANQMDRDGYITALENIEVDEDYKLGIGTAVGAVAGGLLGAKVSSGTAGTVAGAAVGAAAGTYAESKLNKTNAQRVTVQMQTGGQVVIVQPVNSRLSDGMKVQVQGSGENARVVPS